MMLRSACYTFIGLCDQRQARMRYSQLDLDHRSSSVEAFMTPNDAVTDKHLLARPWGA
jgi:hypothetical protein